MLVDVVYPLSIVIVCESLGGQCVHRYYFQHPYLYRLYREIQKTIEHLLIPPPYFYHFSFFFFTKRSGILYRNFVAYCQENPAVYLRDIEIGNIDLANSITYKLKNLRFVYFLHFSNRPWLRSFRLPWDLDGKKTRTQW